MWGILVSNLFTKKRRKMTQHIKGLKIVCVYVGPSLIPTTMSIRTFFLYRSKDQKLCLKKCKLLPSSYTNSLIKQLTRARDLCVSFRSIYKWTHIAHIWELISFIISATTTSILYIVYYDDACQCATFSMLRCWIA